MKIGEMAPNFTLPSQKGDDISLSDFRGENVILYFYTKDNTPGWNKEASEFRDYSDEFKKLNTEIIGISKDSVKTHNKFSDKFDLTFYLLSDENRKIHEVYDVLKPKKMFGKDVISTRRSTFVIDKDGILVKEFKDVKASGHALEIFDYIKNNFK